MAAVHLGTVLVLSLVGKKLAECGAVGCVQNPTTSQAISPK